MAELQHPFPPASLSGEGLEGGVAAVSVFPKKIFMDPANALPPARRPCLEFDKLEL